MSSERFAKAPLLYIHQVDTKKVNAKMQHHYHTSNEVRKEDTTVQGEQKVQNQQSRKVRPKNFYDNRPVVTDVVSGIESEEVVEEKPFQKMTLGEQLNYLTGKPAYAPRLTCEIKTEGRAYRGVILDYKEGIVTIRSGNRSIEIPQETIKQIRMLSL